MWENQKYQFCDNWTKRELLDVWTKLKRIEKNKISKNYVNNRYETETKLLMTKKVCLGLAKLDVRKIVMYECLYDYVKPKYIKNKLMLHVYR